MLFLLPVFAAATVSIGEALGIGASIIGIGAAVKGSADYRKAKSIQNNANLEYQAMAERIKRKSKKVQKRLESFGILKLQTYSGIIHEAVELLSQFITVDLSSFKDIEIEDIQLFNTERIALEESVIKASDVLSCLSAGVNTAVHDRFPYKDTPPIFQTVGAFGLKKVTFTGLPHIPAELIPHAGITMAGITWGMSGSAAKLQAETNAVYVSREIEEMKPIETGFKALLERIGEGESLINTLTGKLRLLLMELESLPESEENANLIANAVSLTRALKQVIEVDICSGNGLLSPESGVLFHTIRKEYVHV
jgi:hypothetical protein